VTPSAGDEPVLVRCIDCVADQGHDLLDWLGALGGAVGGLAAIVALVFAALSARHAARSAQHAEDSKDLAERSAKAAEEELALFRAEVEAARDARSRRADLTFELTATMSSWVSDVPHRMRLTLGYRNAGTRTAARVRVNLQIPDTIEAETAPGPRDLVGRVGHSSTSRLYDDRDAPCRYWSHVLGPVDPGTHYEAESLRLAGPPPTFPVVLVADHEDLPEGSVTLRWHVTLPTEVGGAIKISGPEKPTPGAQ